MNIKLKLKHKLIALFMIMAMIVLITGVFGMWSVNTVGGTIQEILRTKADQQKIAYLIKISLQESQNAINDAIAASPDSDDFQNAKDYFDAKSTFVHNYCDILLNGNAKLGIAPVKKGGPLVGIVQELNSSMSEHVTICNQILDRKASEKPSYAQIQNLKDSTQKSLEKTIEQVDKLLITVNDEIAKANIEATQIKRTANISLIVAIVLAILLAVLLGIMSTRDIVRRIKMMANALAQGAEGDLTAAVPETSHDELGMLGIDFNTMSSRLAEMITKVKNSIREVTFISSTIGNAAKKSSSAATRQAVDLDHVSDAIKAISNSITKVTNDVDRLSMSATETSTATQQMSASLADVTSKSDSLVLSVDSVSSSVTEMIVSIKQIDASVVSLATASTITTSSVLALDEAITRINENAVTTARISSDVLRDAERGQTLVEASIAGMQRIKQSSATTSEAMESLKDKTLKIGDILTVINEVAEQTNLLALNAAIIAAQAGEHGKGFAVVATEIKELAERTSRSTKEIEAVIKDVQQETFRAAASIKVAETCIQEGETLSARSEQAFSKIYAGIRDASEQMAGIAHAAEEQAKQSQQIRSVTGGVSDMVSQIARATREQGSGSELIMSAIHEMKELNTHVSMATAEQNSSGKMIDEQTTLITAMCEHIQQSCHEQQKQFDLIVAAVRSIQESATDNLKASELTDNSAKKLSMHVNALQQEVDLFKVKAD